MPALDAFNPSPRRPIPEVRSADAFYSLTKADLTQHVAPWTPVAFNPSQPALLASQAITASFTAAAETLWGDKVLLVGSTKQLGNWRPADSSVMLTTDNNSYPLWTITGVNLELPPDGTPLEYKVVILRPSCGPGGGATWDPPIEWEPLAENRRLAVHSRHSSKSAHITLRWGEEHESLQWRWDW